MGLNVNQRVYPQLITEAPGLDLTGARKLVIPLQIESSSAATPDVVEFGAYKGFSLPIWATGTTAQEQLFVRIKVPDQWDGKSDGVLRLSACLSGTEATPNAFQFTCSWAASASLGTSTIASADSGDIPIVAGSLAKYSMYEVEMALPSLVADTFIAGRIRRIANSGGAGTEITNEPIVLYAEAEFTVNKIFDSQ